MSAADVSSFEDLMTEAIAEGRLYDTIVADYPDTNISGLGEPGNGYDYKENADEGKFECIYHHWSYIPYNRY